MPAPRVSDTDLDEDYLRRARLHPRLRVSYCPASVDTLVWTLTCDGRPVLVGEDGRLDGDADLVEALRGLLEEPVVVARSGTVPRPETPREDLIVLVPGDGRHIAAAVRMLCRGDRGWSVVEAGFR